MGCLAAAAQDNGLAVAAEREPGWRRAGSPQVSTGSRERPHWTPDAVGVFAAPAQEGLEGFLSTPDGRAEQWYAPGFPLLTDLRMSLQPSLLLFHHCPLQQGKEGSSCCPS